MKESRIPRSTPTPYPNPGGNNDWAECPNSTQEIAALFHLVRRNQEDQEAFARMAQQAHTNIEQQLMGRYGHEQPVDWHDHPVATILALGRAAAQRVAAYTRENQSDANQKVKEWNHILKAYSFSFNAPTGNEMMRAIDQYGKYQSTTVIFE